jgi:hypothetical protein
VYAVIEGDSLNGGIFIENEWLRECGQSREMGFEDCFDNEVEFEVTASLTLKV